VEQGRFLTIKNPETAKRIKRFKRNRLAYASLWVLAVLYVISLGSELVCNSDPLLVRFNGNYYFPVLKYYPENVFLNNGKQTRPNYKKLEKKPEFSENPSNKMIFPPFKYGPFESVGMEDLDAGKTVTLSLNPEVRQASANIRDDLSISRSESFGLFAGEDDIRLEDKKLSDYLDLTSDFKNALALRFENKAAPPFQYTATCRDGSKISVSIEEYSPRGEAPKTVRVNVEDEGADHRKAAKLTVDTSNNPVGAIPSAWNGITETDRKSLLEKAALRFERPVDPESVRTKSGMLRVEFDRKDIRFPYPPCKDHIMGIDEAGRDVFARILYGLRISMTFGLILVACSMSLGITAGALQGYYGGIVDISAQRMIEIWSALPFLYIMILMGSVYGRSFSLLLFCYGIFNWIGISYYVRAEFLRLRKTAFVEAAKCMAIPSWKIIFKHILPNALVPVITFFPFSLVGAIGSLASLDYLGFGMPPPTPSWGELLSQAQQYNWAWWLILYPSLALFIVMLLGVFIGEGIRSAYDPKQYVRME
jgi:microcin C transport system permease protein